MAAGGFGGPLPASLVGPFRGATTVFSLGRSFGLVLPSISVTRVSAGTSCTMEKES